MGSDHHAAQGVNIVAGKHVVSAKDVGFKVGAHYRLQVMALVTGGWRPQPAFTGRYLGPVGSWQLDFWQDTATGGRTRHVRKGALLSVCDEVHVQL